MKKSLPEFSTLEEFIKFVDENDLGDYIESLEEVEFEVKLNLKENFNGTNQ